MKKSAHKTRGRKWKICVKQRTADSIYILNDCNLFHTDTLKTQRHNCIEKACLKWHNGTMGTGHDFIVDSEQFHGPYVTRDFIPVPIFDFAG